MKRVIGLLGLVTHSSLRRFIGGKREWCRLNMQLVYMQPGEREQYQGGEDGCLCMCCWMADRTEGGG